MKALILLLLIAVPTVAQKGYEKKLAKKPLTDQYRKTYDKFRNLTQIETASFTVNRIPDGKSMPSVGVAQITTHEGEAPNGQVEHFWAFRSYGRAVQWGRVDKVIILADGKRLELRPIKRESKVDVVGGPFLTAYSDETVAVPLDREQLDSLLAASKVEVQVGSVEFALHSIALTVFKNVLGTVK